MKICFDWQAIHKGLLSEQENRSTAASVCAAEIREDIFRQGYRSEHLVGRAPEICQQYGLGRETFLEATRLLENWGVARMRRGVNGGLIVANSMRTDPTERLTRYFCLRGLSSAQVREARAVLSLALRHCRESRPAGGSSFDNEFWRLVAHPQPLTTQQRMSLSEAGHPWERCLQIFANAIDAVEEVHDGSAELLFDGAAGSESLARHTVQLLAMQIAGLDREQRSLTRSEASITARLGVSRQVTRQAMRILQDEGLLECRRGRNGGVSILSQHPASVLRLLNGYYRKAGLAREDFSPLLSVIGRANRVLCAMRASESDFARLAALTNEQKQDDPVTHIERIKLEWEIIDNPALSLLEQSLATYRAGLGGEKKSTGFGNLQRIADCSIDHVSAMRARNHLLADRLLQDIESEVAAITRTF